MEIDNLLEEVEKFKGNVAECNTILLTLRKIACDYAENIDTPRETNKKVEKLVEDIMLKFSAHEQQLLNIKTEFDKSNSMQQQQVSLEQDSIRGLREFCKKGIDADADKIKELLSVVEDASKMLENELNKIVSVISENTLSQQSILNEMNIKIDKSIAGQEDSLKALASNSKKHSIFSFIAIGLSGISIIMLTILLLI